MSSLKEALSIVPDPAWALFGGLAVKLADWLLKRKRAESDRVADTYEALNAAQAQFSKGLVDELNNLRTEVHKLHEDLVDSRTQHQDAVKELASVRTELLQLRAELTRYKVRNPGN